jgi:hypothetical protein
MKIWCTEQPFSASINNQDNVDTPCLITSWFFIHLLISGFLYLILMYNFKSLTKLKGFIIVLFLHTLYEIKDLGYYMGFLKQGEWTDNSPLNSIGDTLGCITGILLMMKFVKPINIRNLLLVGSIVLLTKLLFIIKGWDFIGGAVGGKNIYKLLF